jgi:hypothetical protein
LNPCKREWQKKARKNVLASLRVYLCASLTFPFPLLPAFRKTISAVSFFFPPHHLRIIIISSDVSYTKHTMELLLLRVEGEERRKKRSEEKKRVRNVNDRPTQAKYFYVSSR